MTSFIHLAVHSEYSLCDSIIRIKEYIKWGKQHNMPALALADRGNLFGCLKFYHAAIKAGIKPLIGCELTFSTSSTAATSLQITAYAMNLEGYSNLLSLASAHQKQLQANFISSSLTDTDNKSQLTDNNYHINGIAANINLDLLQQYHQGLLLIIDLESAKIANANLDLALSSLKTLLNDRLYLGLAKLNSDAKQTTTLYYANKYDLAIVAINPAVCINPEDFEAHEVKLCIQRGLVLNDQKSRQNKYKIYYPGQYLQTPAQMQELFADLPNAIQNTVEFAKRCNLKLELNQVFLPKFSIQPDLSPEQSLEIAAKAGLKTYLSNQNTKAETEYHDRLSFELSIINKMGFASYFLIVADFIQWAKNHDIPVGPGRGSGAGSLVAFCLQITNLDPLLYDLLFERFLNPERVSMPDFDIDFCIEGRDRVIQYVMQKYGIDAVSQIITYGTMAAKAVVRDVGRALGLSYGLVDSLAKLIPNELNITLQQALEQEPKLAVKYQQDPEIKSLLDLALKLEGLTRNIGRHAGGVVIAPGALDQYSPVYFDVDSGYLLSQFDKNDIETAGLVKFDFLGLKTLTIIKNAVDLINQKNINQQNIDHIPLDDPETFKLLQAGLTTAIFQLESRGMKELIQRLKPDCFEDIIALVALYRPGPLQSGMVDDFINRKLGTAQIIYPHPDLEPILKPTYGVILYQEQVMQIAQVLGQYTLGAADLLRRAMGKKKPEEMAKQRAIFVQGATNRGVDAQQASYIFDLMEKFAGYGFNKSHSAAYALVSYQTAWLKAHYPAEFMAAVLSADMANTDKLTLFLEDCQQLNLKVLGPDINLSAYKFSVTKAGQIRYGLGAIKGLGSSAIDNILEARAKKLSFSNSGSDSNSSSESDSCSKSGFANLFDFCASIDAFKVNKKAMAALIHSGATDIWLNQASNIALENSKLASDATDIWLNHAGIRNRQQLLALVPTALALVEQKQTESQQLQLSLLRAPDWPEVLAEALTKPEIQSLNKLTLADKLNLLDQERSYLGGYFSGHPLDYFNQELKHFGCFKPSSLNTKTNNTTNKADAHWLAGLVLASRQLITKNGHKLMFISLGDEQTKVEIMVPESLFSQKQAITPGNLLFAKVQVQNNQYGLKIKAEQLANLEEIRAEYATALLLKFSANFHQLPTEQYLQVCRSLREILKQCPGELPVLVAYYSDLAYAKGTFGSKWRVQATQALLDQLQELAGLEVSFYYQNTQNFTQL